jgi:hypothetical protein
MNRRLITSHLWVARAQPWVVALVLAIVLGSWAGGGSAQAATSARVRVPHVRGDVISVYNRLHRLGLRVTFPHGLDFDLMSPPQVAGIWPHAGRRVKRGSVVTLYLARGPARTLDARGRLPRYRVPRLVGGYVNDAYRWVSHKKLIFRAYLAPLKGGSAPGLLANYRVTRQHPAPGARLTLGRPSKGVRGGGQGVRETPLSVWGRPRPPIPATGPARAITQTSAAVGGTVNPAGESTRYHFDYGPTAAYGRSTRARQAGWGNGNIRGTARISRLQPASVYHYRVVAKSSAGTVYGADRIFVTAGYYRNPLYTRTAMPDPFVLDNGGRHNDYWAYATGNRFPMLHSTNLVNWSPAGTAMAGRPSWVTTAADWHPWGPSVLSSNQPCPGATSGGCYIMYYTGLSAQLNVNCIGVATSPTPSGPFVDHGPLDLASDATPGLPLGCGDDSGRGNIDPSAFIDPTGRPYLYVSTNQVCADGSCSRAPTISVIPLSADYLHAASGRIPLFTGAAATWEATSLQVPTVEGPALELHNGVYYLFYSGGNWRAAYGMGYATSSSPTGPFSKASAPILAQSAAVRGPGGGDQLVTGPHGGQWLVYHGRSSAAAPRTLRLDRVTWTPAASPGAPDSPTINGPTATPQPVRP